MDNNWLGSYSKEDSNYVKPGVDTGSSPRNGSHRDTNKDHGEQKSDFSANQVKKIARNERKYKLEWQNEGYEFVADSSNFILGHVEAVGVS